MNHIIQITNFFHFVQTESVELLITIRLHYGGTYVNAPCPTHSRDSVSVIDNVGISYISLEGIRRLCDVVGLEGVMGLYLKDECGGFVLILCNKELKTCFLNTMMNPDMQEMSIYVDCVGVASRVEMEGHNIGLDDDVADGLCGNDEGGGEEGYESSDCDHFVDSEYEMESDTDFGINVIGGDDGLTDVNLDDGVDDLGNNLQNVNGNAEEGENVVVTDGSSELGRGEDVSNSGSDNVVESGDDFLSVKGSDSESEGSSFPVFNSAEVWKPVFELGMKFSSKTLLREAVHSHAIATMRNINIKKNDLKRLHAKCAAEKCDWKLHALKEVGEEGTFWINLYNDKHTCCKSYHVKNMKSSWIARKHIKKFKSDPKRSVKGFEQC